MLVSLTVLLLACIAAAQRDWNQCYYAEGAVGPPELLPCLNETDPDANGASWCCLAGDKCLGYGGCWDPDEKNNSGTTNTYQYGCNDPTYKHKNCPSKCGYDAGLSPWVGLISCESKDSASANQPWVCVHPESCGTKCPTDPKNADVTLSMWPFDLIRLPELPSRCADLNRTVFATQAPTSIPNQGSVALTYTGTTKPSATRVPIRSRLSTLASSPTATAESNGGAATLGGGAIAGIAVGSTLGVVAILAGILFMWRRRRAKRAGQAVYVPPPAAPDHHTPAAASHDPYLYDKQNMAYPSSPSNLSDGVAIQRPVSDMSMSTLSPTPMGSPRPQASSHYPQGGYAAQGPYGSHAELSEDARVMYEMPAIREKSERSELP